MAINGMLTRKVARITEELCGTEFSSPPCRICTSNWIRWCLSGTIVPTGHAVSLYYRGCDGAEGTGRGTSACTRCSPRHRGE
jgi:hypothetical protein